MPTKRCDRCSAQTTSLETRNKPSGLAKRPGTVLALDFSIRTTKSAGNFSMSTTVTTGPINPRFRTRMTIAFEADRRDRGQEWKFPASDLTIALVARLNGVGVERRAFSGNFMSVSREHLEQNRRSHSSDRVYNIRNFTLVRED